MKSFTIEQIFIIRHIYETTFNMHDKNELKDAKVQNWTAMPQLKM